MMIFMKKKELEQLINDRISYALSDHRICSHQEYKTCEVCGCFVADKEAVKGDSIVKTRDITTPYCPSMFYYGLPQTEEYLYTPYYCKVHGRPKGIKK